MMKREYEEIFNEPNDQLSVAKERKISVYLPKDLFNFLDFLPMEDHFSFQLVSKDWNDAFGKTKHANQVTFTRILRNFAAEYDPSQNDAIRVLMCKYDAAVKNCRGAIKDKALNWWCHHHAFNNMM